MSGFNIRRSAPLIGWALLASLDSTSPLASSVQAQSPQSQSSKPAEPHAAVRVESSQQTLNAAYGAGFNAVCVLVDSQGNRLDLSRICGSSRALGRASGSDRSQPSAIAPTQPRPTQAPTAQLPDYGVIFLNSVGNEPIHLGYRANYLTSGLGNASSGMIRNLRLYYDILVSIDGEYASIGKGSKLIRAEPLAPGQRTAVKLSRIDVMDHVMPAFRPNRDISIQVTALGWTEADGSRNSFAPDSYKLARGIGHCHFPWEQDSWGHHCGTRAVSSKLAAHQG